MQATHQMHTVKRNWIWHYIQTEWQRFFGVNVSLIDPLLYVGGQFTPKQWQTLYAMGIRAVLNLQDEREDCFMENIPSHMLRLPVVDHHAPSVEQLGCAVEFIARAHEQHLPVLVHCQAGIGRAPTTAAAYLMAERDMDRTAAINYLRVSRPNIMLNRQQRQRLSDWEAHVGMLANRTY
jgi:protein tyrosine phosphatase (PTP) superfamily phosphohydrolase (DUF442 family)